jgi:hypothetical protein
MHVVEMTAVQRSRRWTVMIVAWLAGALVLAACGRPETQPLLFGAAPWRAGEISSYTITDKDGGPAGLAQYIFSDTALEGGGWQMERIINAQQMQESVIVRMEANGFRPVESNLVRTGSNGEETVDALFDGAEVNLTLNTKLNIMTVQRAQVTSDVRENASLLMLLRAMPLARGYATVINTFVPIAGQMDRVRVFVTGEETLTVPAGAYPVWTLELESADGAVTKAWIGKEAPYQLVQFTDGRNNATFALTDLVP